MFFVENSYIGKELNYSKILRFLIDFRFELVSFLNKLLCIFYYCFYNLWLKYFDLYGSKNIYYFYLYYVLLNIDDIS